MTRMLVVVRTAEDVAAAVAGGADGLVADLRIAMTDGVRSALDSIVAAAAGRCPIAIFSPNTMPDQSLEPLDDRAVTAVFATMPIGDLPWRGATVTAVLPLVGKGTGQLVETAAARGFGGVLIGEGLQPQRLLQAVTIDGLADLARQARERSMAIGFAGTLEAPDIPRLLALAPDFLVVDELVRETGQPAGPIDPVRIRFVRDMIPREEASSAQGQLESIGHDRIFVRDWTVSIHVGAYSHESAPQRARFTVEVEVAVAPHRVTDLRDVVTYDLVTDAIARATTGHVDLVETLAEEVAALVLAHPRAVSVDVTVEKLDLGPGSLGCRIVRRRGEPA